MTTTSQNPKVDLFLGRASKWSEELAKLRTILLDCGLTEEIKWGKPCYIFQNTNVIVLLPLKEHCGLLFFKGALMDDPNGILIQPGEESQASRQMRFSSLQEIVAMETIVKAYINEAIAVEKAGLKVNFKKIDERPVPEELQRKLDESPELKTAFAALTPGRQRAYFLYITAPKQPKTRESRVEKCIPQILDGKGLNDR